jgi:hypothetical protein
LFGNVTVLKDGELAHDGFVALAEFDDNHDGRIDADDAVYARLRLWSDRKRNGISETAELLALPQVGLRSISLDARISRRQDRWGNSFRYRADAWFVTTPQRRQTVDVFLQSISVGRQ